MLKTIIQAIHDRETLRINYNGGERIVEPHCCGYGTDGQALLRCFQVYGFSRSGHPTAWKLMSITAIRLCVKTGNKFSSPRPGYNPHGDKAIPRVLAKI